MRNLLYAVTALAVVTAIPAAANAANILNFSQAVTGDFISATANSPAAGQTTVSSNGNVGVSVNCISGCGALVTPFMTLTATSIGAATVDSTGKITQSVNGTFDIKSGSLSVLHAVFTDGAIFGSGSSLTLSVSNATPGESLTFSSDIIPAADLGDPLGLSLSLADVHVPGSSPPVGAETTPLGCSGTSGCTLNDFVASISGTASANVVPQVPEPASLALMGVGLLGLGFVTRKRRG